MISAGTNNGVWIDLGKDEPGMTLQRREREGSGLSVVGCCYTAYFIGWNRLWIKLKRCS
jgi:hypothetical protein